MSSKFDTAAQKASYGIGLQVGNQLARGQVFDGMDSAAIAAGLVDALEGKESQLDQATLEQAFSEIDAQIKAKAQAEGASLAAEGEAFLKENAQREGVKTLESGLQYEVLQEGSGETPSASSTVKTHYHGTLTNGEVFDSSVERGQPAEFPVNGVIAGWTEALQQMRVGSKWRLYVPPHLAYGDRGAGGKIGPNATLIFDVELIDIVS